MLQAERGRERDAYWASRRYATGGAPCSIISNRSAECSDNGACRVSANVSTTIAQVAHRPICVCEDGFAGSRCGYAAFSRLRAGGAACNATNPCGGEGSSCTRMRCVCGRGWLGARCSFAGLSVIARGSGGAACNSSSDCSGEQTGNSCVKLNGMSSGRCKCGSGRVGARCAYAAFGDLLSGGGACNSSNDCAGRQLPLPLANLSTPNSSSLANRSTCVQGRCLCAAGWLGAHCKFSSSMLWAAAASRSRRERAHAQQLHLCLSVWRGGDVGSNAVGFSGARKEGGVASAASDESSGHLSEGAPIVFALCRRRANQHQQWDLLKAAATPPDKSTQLSTSGAARAQVQGITREQSGRGEESMQILMRSQGEIQGAGLCITATPLVDSTG